MLFLTTLNGNIGLWNVSSVENMRHIFFESKFNGDLSEWIPMNVRNVNDIFPKNFVIVPSWVGYQDIDERKKILETLYLKKKLDQGLIINNISNKKTKI